MGINKLLGYAALISLVSTVMLVFAIFIWGFTNDYLLYESNEAIQKLEGTGAVSQEDLDEAENIFGKYLEISFLFDWWWLGSYIFTFITTVLIAYKTREEEYFSWLTLVFYGVMFGLFFLSIINTFTEWWVDEILYNMMPIIQGMLPMFTHFSNNIGIYTFVHFLVLLVVNRWFFNIQSTIKKTGFKGDDELL